MRMHLRFAARAAAFLCVLSLAVWAVNRVLVAKSFMTTVYPTTNTYLGFYEMQPNTVDVLILGSSHAANDFIPQALYDLYGIRSYNIGSAMQNMPLSYYWLKEALKYQSPKVVVLECYLLFDYKPEEPLNMEEPHLRSAVDVMRWGDVKRELVDLICSVDRKQSRLSYYLPNIRFHTRWKELGEDDFTISEMSVHTELKGYCLFTGKGNHQEYKPYVTTEQGEVQATPLMEEYLNKIIDLCKERGIELILVKNPALLFDAGKHNTLQRIAKANDLLFLDFNEQELYHEIGFQFADDMHDYGHANLAGAYKITKYVGNVISRQYGVLPKRDLQWESTAPYFEGVRKDFILRHETDVSNYVSMLRDDRYTVFLVVKDEAANSMGDDLKNQLKGLGLQADWSDAAGKSYAAVISGQEVLFERMDSGKIEQTGSIRDGRVIYSVSSAGAACGSDCSVKINNEEHAEQDRGLNIVVYNNVTKTVIDTVCFDTSTPECTVYRQ